MRPHRTSAALLRRLLGVAIYCLLAGCLPDIGGPLPDSTDAAVSADLATSMVDAAHGDDGGGSPDLSGVDLAGGSGFCNKALPPSQSVDRYVWAQNFTFFFSPGSDPTKLEVPANADVHLSLAQDQSEESHTFTITLAGCESGETGLGSKGAETMLTWRSPTKPTTFTAGGKCRQHPGMEFDIVVTP